ncbi:DUF4300 family protein [Aedoeadaptatus coli]|uniref:DUF4300 family protein n=1 Tax=Aedoeadaptatus coli TaxID=2058292 RepID=UPI000D55BBF9|nr:DUF4300 family protein [Peptoniphilus coli]
MKRRKIILLGLCLVALAACRNQPAGNKADAPEGRRAAFAPTSNLVEPADARQVQDALKGPLNPKDVDRFFDLVRDYNASVGEALLPAAFGNKGAPVYDVGKIIDARDKSKAKAPDTNCRINAFLLLKDGLVVPEGLAVDDAMLFMDNEALAARPLLADGETAAFRRLFSRVKTDDSRDAAHQGRVMEKFLSQITFPADASMVSVVLHDNLDGNYLFIGHVGVLVKDRDGYIFVEKISFEEPYQALKFPTKAACYAYLADKFKEDRDPDVAPPFIMDNDRCVGAAE